MNTFEVPTKFVVTALEDGKRVYMDYDANSGGYPYWSGLSSAPHTYESLIRALNAYKDAISTEYMNSRVTDICIGKLSTIVEIVEVDGEAAVEERRQEALSKLSADDRRVLGI